MQRMKNILRQAHEAGKEVAASVDLEALQEPAEKELALQCRGPPAP